MPNLVHVFEGKTTNEAIEKGLKQLRLSKKDVEIKVLDNEDKRSFFSILAPRVVKVELTVKEGRNQRKTSENSSSKQNENNKKKEKRKIDNDSGKKAIQNVKGFLEEFLPKVSSEKLEYELYLDEYYLNVEIKGEDTGFLIGYRGETLNSIQTLLSSIASNGTQEKIRVILDISGYREKRKKALEDLTNRISNKVLKNRKPYTLEPMTAYERKVIHEKLQNHPKLKTTSVGEEPYRKVVISLK